jgi:hypothetical protein
LASGAGRELAGILMHNYELLIKILGQLGSEHDAIALSAALAADMLRRKAGLTRGVNGGAKAGHCGGVKVGHLRRY